MLPRRPFARALPARAIPARVCADRRCGHSGPPPLRYNIPCGGCWRFAPRSGHCQVPDEAATTVDVAVPGAAEAVARLDRLLSLVSVGKLRVRLHDRQRDFRDGWRLFLVLSRPLWDPERTEPAHRSILATATITHVGG